MSQKYQYSTSTHFKYNTTIDYIDFVPGIVQQEHSKEFLQTISTVLINNFVRVVVVAAADEKVNKKVSNLIECTFSMVACILDDVQVPHNLFPVVS